MFRCCFHDIFKTNDFRITFQWGANFRGAQLSSTEHVLFYLLLNVWCIKNRTRHSTKALLSLVRFLMHQTLLDKTKFISGFGTFCQDLSREFLSFARLYLCTIVCRKANAKYFNQSQSYSELAALWLAEIFVEAQNLPHIGLLADCCTIVYRLEVLCLVQS